MSTRTCRQDGSKSSESTNSMGTGKENRLARRSNTTDDPGDPHPRTGKTGTGSTQSTSRTQKPGCTKKSREPQPNTKHGAPPARPTKHQQTKDPSGKQQPHSVPERRETAATEQTNRHDRRSRNPCARGEQEAQRPNPKRQMPTGKEPSRNKPEPKGSQPTEEKKEHADQRPGRLKRHMSRPEVKQRTRQLTNGADVTPRPKASRSGSASTARDEATICGKTMAPNPHQKSQAKANNAVT
ncbi:serine/arginine repetitive matrix protein 1-like [Procambarus clarkii]|uniref:serine/arginine repetitive matrix protein 1-like n=1 Tax=Procambarus clarkii TaxID=6728 RepID=UPI0037429110